MQATSRPILIVEDDRKTSELLSAHLGREGFDTVAAYAGREALALASCHHPILTVLDVMLPDLDGWDVCRRLRGASNAPVLMLSALGQAHDRIKGLTFGADDYMVKPFSFAELAARVRAILRRAAVTEPVSTPATLSHEGLRVDVAKRRVTADGRAVCLTRSEYRLLQALMVEPGRVFLREELLRHLYADGGVVVPRVIDVHIGKLRQKIEQDPSNPRHVLTERGLGYRFAESEAWRPIDYASENAALRRLASELANPASNVLGSLAEVALELCAADSAGISVLEPDAREPMFRWHAIRGDWSKYEGQGLPRDGSPCGVTIARNQTCLMSHPERHFPAVAAADPQIGEVLLTPFVILGEPLGTVWVIFHEIEGRPQRAFDNEHVRLMESLARFASNAFLLQEQARNATETRDEALRANRRLMQVLQRLGHVSEDVPL